MSGYRSRLTQIVLEQFKGFADARASLGGFTVVVGTNASGKSNLRDALRFLHGIARGYTLAEITYSASDGTLRFLAMVAAFLGPEPARLYFFEELETGLHPTRLHLLLQLIEGRVQAGASQVIATTHSPQLLAFLAPATVADAILAYRKEGDPQQSLVRLNELPGAGELFDQQNVSRLFAATRIA